MIPMLGNICKISKYNMLDVNIVIPVCIRVVPSIERRWKTVTLRNGLPKQDRYLGGACRRLCPIGKHPISRYILYTYLYHDSEAFSNARPSQ